MGKKRERGFTNRRSFFLGFAFFCLDGCGEKEGKYEEEWSGKKIFYLGEPRETRQREDPLIQARPFVSSSSSLFAS